MNGRYYWILMTANSPLGRGGGGWRPSLRLRVSNPPLAPPKRGITETFLRAALFFRHSLKYRPVYVNKKAEFSAQQHDCADGNASETSSALNSAIFF